MDVYRIADGKIAEGHVGVSHIALDQCFSICPNRSLVALCRRQPLSLRYRLTGRPEVYICDVS